MRDGEMVPDGSYDVIVIDSSTDEAGGLHLGLAILAGAHKGEVLTIRAEGLAINELDALGIPGTLVVAGAQPTFRAEP